MLLRHGTNDRKIAKLLIHGGARLSDAFIISAVRDDNRNICCWLKAHEELLLPTGLSPVYDSSCKNILGTGTTTTNSSSSSTLAVPAAVAASPDGLHEFLCVVLCCLGISRCTMRGTRAQETIAIELLQQHRATAAQWTRAQLLQMLKLCTQYHLRDVLQALVQQVAVPAVQQQQLSQQQLEELIHLGTRLMHLNVLWPLYPDPLPRELLLPLMQYPGSSEAARIAITLLRQLTEEELLEVMLKLAAGAPMMPQYEPLELVFQQLPAARALPVAVAEQLLRAAVVRGIGENAKVICRSLPSVQQLSVEVVKELVSLGIEGRVELSGWVELLQPFQQLSVAELGELLSATIRGDMGLKWAQQLPLPKELLLQHMQLLIDVSDYNGGKVLAVMPAAATLTEAEVEGVVRAVIAGRRVAGEGRRAVSRRTEEYRPSINPVGQWVLEYVPSSKQLPAVFELMQELACSHNVAALDAARNDRFFNHTWSTLASLPGAGSLPLDHVVELLQLAVHQQLELDPLLQLPGVKEQLTVEQLLMLLQGLVGLLVSSCKSSNSGTVGGALSGLHQLLLVPAAHQLTTDQLHPLLLECGSSSVGEVLLQLPAAKHFSAQQLIQLAEALVEQRGVAPVLSAADAKVGSASTLQALLNLAAAEKFDEGLVGDLLLPVLQWTSADLECYEKHWERQKELKLVQQLSLQQLIRLLEVGFKQGRVPGLLWDLPAAQDLTVEQLQQLVGLGDFGKQPMEGDRVGESSGRNDKSKGACYRLAGLAGLPAAQQLPCKLVLQLLRSSVSSDTEGIDLLVKQPGMDGIAAEQAQRPEWVRQEVCALAGLPGAQELTAEQTWVLVEVSVAREPWIATTDLLQLLPGAKGLAAGQVKQLLDITLGMLTSRDDLAPYFKLCLCGLVSAVLRLPAAEELETQELQHLLVQLPGAIGDMLDSWNETLQSGLYEGWVPLPPGSHRPKGSVTNWLIWRELGIGQKGLQHCLATVLELIVAQGRKQLTEQHGEQQQQPEDGEGVLLHMLSPQQLRAVARAAAACSGYMKTLSDELDESDKAATSAPLYNTILTAMLYCQRSSRTLIRYLQMLLQPGAAIGPTAAAAGISVSGSDHHGTAFPWERRDVQGVGSGAGSSTIHVAMPAAAAAPATVSSAELPLPTAEMQRMLHTLETGVSTMDKEICRLIKEPGGQGLPQVRVDFLLGVEAAPGPGRGSSLASALAAAPAAPAAE